MIARGTPAQVAVGVNYGVPRLGVPASGSFRTWIAAALAGTGWRKASTVGIRLVGARESRQMNLRFRRQDHATNVLSFTAELESHLCTDVLGDLALCVPVVMREAREQGKSVRAHFAHLTVHGTLHLLGFDHQRTQEAARMEQLEIEILRALKFDDPYR